MKKKFEDHDPLLTLAEAGQQLNVGSRSVKDWIESGELAGGKLPGGHWRVRTSSIAAMLEARGLKQAPRNATLTSEEMQALIARHAIGELKQDMPAAHVIAVVAAFGRAVERATLARVHDALAGVPA